MNSRSKVAMTSLSLVSLVALVAGCGNSSAGNKSTPASNGTTTTGNSSGNVTNITVWETELNQTLGQKLATAFNSSHPNVHVTMQYISQPDTFLQKLTAAISTGSEPDMVVGGDPSWGPQLLQTGKLVDLKGKVDSIDSQITPGILAAEMYKGHQVGMPYGMGDYALFYNKSDFAKAGIQNPPQTWTEVVQDAVKLTNAANQQYGFYVPFGSNEWTVYAFEGMLWANGGEFLNKNQTQAAFNSPAGVKALQTWVDLLYKYHAAPTTSFANASGSDGAPAFASNVAAMVVDGPWAISTFKQAGVKYGLTLFPKGTSGYATNSGIGNLWVFNRGSQNVQASLEFLKWFMKPDNLAQIQITSQNLPVLSAVNNVPAFQQFEANNPDYKVFADNAKYAKARPTLVSYPAISAALGKEIDKALHNQESPQAALDKAAQEANQILKQNNE